MHAPEFADMTSAADSTQNPEPCTQAAASLRRLPGARTVTIPWSRPNHCVSKELGAIYAHVALQKCTLARNRLVWNEVTLNSNQAEVPVGPAGDLSARGHETIAPRDNLYIPSLDGIRAISFLLVFFAHAGLGAMIIPGGFGVTIFFLLSGFLITTLLRLEFARYQRISLRSFYLRRVLRILPPLYVSLALAVVLFRVAAGHPAIPLAGTLAQVFQVANFYEIYANPAVTMPGTAVLWSLAVEEHFYLLFPLLYAWMCPRFPAHRQAIILLALCAAALAWRCVLHFHFGANPIRTYYGTDTRFDSILWGCVFAIVANPMLKDPMHEWLVQRMKWILPLGVIVLLGTFLERDDGFRETLRYTLQGLALIPLFIAAMHYQMSWPVQFLNLSTVRFLGVLSYSLYLCHSIIMASVERNWSANPVLAGAISLAGALAFATLVHYWIERPCTRIRKRLSKVMIG
jgi:peptidoglycan/LPS O-acetylase OafA/YrhL